jgi:hypothetical protein
LVCPVLNYRTIQVLSSVGHSASTSAILEIVGPTDILAGHHLFARMLSVPAPRSFVIPLPAPPLLSLSTFLPGLMVSLGLRHSFPKHLQLFPHEFANSSPFLHLSCPYLLSLLEQFGQIVIRKAVHAPLLGCRIPHHKFSLVILEGGLRAECIESVVIVIRL